MKAEEKFDKLKVHICENRSSAGADAANAVSKRINDILNRQDLVNVIFAAAPSQNEFLFFLSGQQGIDWSRVNVFQMDEYVGLEKNSARLFGNFLKERLFDKVPVRSAYYLDGNVSNLEAECGRYANLLRQYPPDITCMGIGVNAHIAFNDPHVADFNDPLPVKIVTLDPVCRQQQVDDGSFDQMDEVPSYAITLTIPSLLQASYISCVVPGAAKAQAVYHTLLSDISEKYPSTVLRTHADAILYLDRDSSSKL